MYISLSLSIYIYIYIYIWALYYPPLIFDLRTFSPKPKVM